MSKRNKAVKAAANPVRIVKSILQATAWSEPHQTPAREGIYEVKADDGTPHTQYAYWYGFTWYAGAMTIEGAQQHLRDGQVRLNQQVTWRGVVK